MKIINSFSILGINSIENSALEKIYTDELFTDFSSTVNKYNQDPVFSNYIFDKDADEFSSTEQDIYDFTKRISNAFIDLFNKKNLGFYLLFGGITIFNAINLIDGSIEDEENNIGIYGLHTDYSDDKLAYSFQDGALKVYHEMAAMEKIINKNYEEKDEDTIIMVNFSLIQKGNPLTIIKL